MSPAVLEKVFVSALRIVMDNMRLRYFPLFFFVINYWCIHTLSALILFNLSPDIIPKKQNNWMLEVAKNWGSICLSHSVLSSSPFLQCLPQGCVSVPPPPNNFTRNHILLAPLPRTSAAPASDMPLELFNARPRFVILHVLFSCPRQKWLNCSWFLPSFYFVSFKKFFFQLREYITILLYAVIRISLLG